MANERLDNLLGSIRKVFDESEETEKKRTLWRLNRNMRALQLLRAMEIFGGVNACPVCGSPPKWNPGKKPTDSQRRDLHEDKCELDIMIRHFTSCVDAPGIW
jgi:hypothetical protein